MSAARKCRGCGTDVPANAPFGHCPKCLLELGFGPIPEAARAPGPSAQRSFGDYELLEQIGRGGMGVIYKARQITLNRLVALKMVKPDEFASPSLIERFHIEAEAAANLHHANIVPIYETGEHQGQHFFSMELIDGHALDRYICNGGFAIGEQKTVRARHEQIARIMAKVARAVDYAHQHGVLHRDLKPSNILLDKQHEPRLTDFGVAKVIGHAGSSLTVSGAIMGTPSYMAPEQAAGKSKTVTTAADTYSLGAILYAMLTGQPPFSAETPVETLKQVVEEEPRHPSTFKDGIDRDLATICMKCLEKEPQRRYGSAAALADDLERWLRKEPIEARPTGPILRARRWVQRNPAVAMLMIGLLFGFIASLILLKIANEQRHAKADALRKLQTQERDKERTAQMVRNELKADFDELYQRPEKSAFVLINSEKRRFLMGPYGGAADGPVVQRYKFGIYSHSQTPSEMLPKFAAILDYLEDATTALVKKQVGVDFLIFRSYEDAMTALLKGEMDFVRFGAASYVTAKWTNPAVSLVIAQKHVAFQGAIFTQATNTAIRTMDDLTGKSFAFGNPISTTGSQLARVFLMEHGVRGTNLAFFTNLANHAAVSNAVFRGEFQAGAAKESFTGNPALKVLGTYPNIGMVWVARPGFDPQTIATFRKALLSLPDPKLVQPLEDQVIGFEAKLDRDYDGLRQKMRDAGDF